MDIKNKANQDTLETNNNNVAKMPSVQTFNIVVEGLASHGSTPNFGIDAITIAATIIENLQEIISRQHNPLLPAVLTISSIHGGSRFNVLANKVVMKGSAHTINEGKWMEEHIRKIVEDTAKIMGGKAWVENYSYDSLDR